MSNEIQPDTSSNHSDEHGSEDIWNLRDLFNGTTNNNNEITGEGATNNNEINEQGTTNNNNEITDEGATNNNEINEEDNTNNNNNEITEEGTTNNNNEITDEGATNNNEIIEEGTTNNNNEITGEGATNNNEIIEEGTTNNNNNNEITDEGATNNNEITEEGTTNNNDITGEVAINNNEITEEGTTNNNNEITGEDLDTSLFNGNVEYGDNGFVLVIEDDTANDTAELMNAIKEGEWEKARVIVSRKNVKWTSELKDDGTTALHYAVGAYKNNQVVNKILMGIDPEELVTTVDSGGRNPAHTAALFDNTEALGWMSYSNSKCLFTPDKSGYLPIHYALHMPTNNKNTFHDLFKLMKSLSNKVQYGKLLSGEYGDCGLSLLHQVIDAGLIDVAYVLINDKPRWGTMEARGETALECIIRKPELFYSGTSYGFYSRFFYHIVPIENQETPKKDKFVTKHMRRCLDNVPHVKRLREDKEKHNTTIKLLRRIWDDVDQTHTIDQIKRRYSSPFFLAVENNTAEAIDVLTTKKLALYASKKDGHNPFQLTVLNRSEKVYNYILHHFDHATTAFSTCRDDDGNNILHLAGCIAPGHILNFVSGAALQMQRELQWFEELKRVVGIAHTRALNNNKETPMMVFRREHKELRKDGEEWMKKAADSYTITAALIMTIVFAAAITVPGGNDSAGKPIYETKASLIIFAISDAISLFTSTTSFLLFLSILTARYADEDFLYKLPKRLIFGLVMLFVSVTSMMIAFSAALYIMFGQEKQMILITIAALACLPIASFVTLQFPLLVELISSTYGHGYFGNEKVYRQSSATANKKKRA